ncbi:putative Cell cycle and apoptosis regulator protein [Helianthus anomalus]
MVTIDKKLLQVEDLRLTLHASGNCMSHRDVKELVQSTLLESNTGRDDRILYARIFSVKIQGSY